MTLAIEEREHALVARIEHAARRNAISLGIMAALESLVTSLAGSHDSRPFLLCGSQGWFASGGDLREFSHLDAAEISEMAARMASVLRAIEELPCPTVAVLNGPAIGGGAELCLAFDIRVAVEGSYLRFPETHLGVTTGWQGAERLADTVGYSSALELLLTGRKVNVDEALRMGLVNKVFAAATFDTEVNELVRTLHESGEAGRAVKGLLQMRRRSERTDGALERDAFVRLWSHPRRRLAMERAVGRRAENIVAPADGPGDNVTSQGAGK